LEPAEHARFEAVILPQLSAAYTLARYLTRNGSDAEDVVQDAVLRAMKYFSGFRGEGGRDSRAWLLTIVRNTAYTWKQRQHASGSATEFDETLHSEAIADAHPDAALAGNTVRATVAEAVDRLAPEFREVIVLRELEGLSYKEISEVVGVPIGTIMSRLSRARRSLQEVLIASDKER
jgi:RNA polymerase sigma-70 factor (ECF subfamily)